MNSRYDDAEAKRYIDTYGPEWGEDLALRVYTSHLIGGDPTLVLHGGGNTSVKSLHRDLFGRDIPALYVKGSGWNLGDIEPEGFPGVDLAYLQQLIQLPELSDEEMVNAQRTHMFNASSPNPSVETLLHGFLPAKFVDHSHANVILALTNHPDGERYIKEALGERICIVPYIKPGYDLARLAAQCFTAFPECEAMVLMNHGLFTWGATARESYEKHLELVTRAETYLAQHPAPATSTASAAAVSTARERATSVLPILRGALSGPQKLHWILDTRDTPELLGLASDPRISAWVDAGCLTPDHVLRTKPYACLITLTDDPGKDRETIEAAVNQYRETYAQYFTTHSHRSKTPLKRLDTTPRVIIIPGVGIIGVGNTTKAAAICADITEHTLAVKSESEGLTPFQGLPEPDIFDVEYWSLEQAKLGKKTPPPLTGQVAFITGGAGAIGRGIASELLSKGCVVALCDIDADALADAQQALNGGKQLFTVTADITKPESLASAFAQTIRAFGGIDLIIPNAGIALSAPITGLSASDFAKVMEVNAQGTYNTLHIGAKLLKAQGIGGHIVLVSSKNVFGPGAEFAAYSASKAAAHQLCKVAALELAADGIRVNMVNPDAVFSGGGTESGLWNAVGPSRAAAKGLKPSDLPAHYQQRNLLNARVTAEDVGRAIVFFVTEQTPTTGASLPVDGGIPGAFPR